MGAKKKYPEPFRRPDSQDSKVYYFMLEGKDGKRHRMSTGETSKELAREFIRTYLDDQRSGSTALTFAEYAEPFYIPETCPHFIRYRQEGKSIGLQHLSQCRSLLKRHVLTDVAFARRPIAKIKRGDLLDLRSRLLKSGMGVNTVNKCVSATKTILSEASFRGDIDFNPGAEVGDIKYQKTERAILTPEEIGAFLAFLGERTKRTMTLAKGATPIKPGAKESRQALDAAQAMRDEAMLSFLFCTGARAAEIQALRWSAIDLNTGRCCIEKAFKGKDGLGLPKWGKVRDIMLAKLVLERLKAWKKLSSPDLQSDCFVFGTPDGKWLGYEGLHNVLENALKEARDEKILPDDERLITSHSARHSLNTNLLAAGVAPLLVQSFLGWSSAEARILTRVQVAYTHLSLLRVEDVAKAVDLMYAPPKTKRQEQLG
jgi:integrase